MKRIFVAAFALLAMATTASAQNYEVVNDSVAAETTNSGTSILAQLMDNAMTEVPAAYPGGARQLMADLAANLEYPTIAIESDLQGRVLLQFVVTRQGKISEPSRQRDIKEALSVSSTPFQSHSACSNSIPLVMVKE